MGKLNKITKSASGRFMELTSLATRVGSSVIGTKTMNAFRDALSKEEHLSKSWVINAGRIVETLGKMKGGAMKIGQMLSLQEGLLPPEVAKVLSTLQNSAPPVEFEVLHETIKRELGENYNLIESIDPEPYASASIGQVHRARLKNGHEVVIKVQYPDIDEVVKADLTNLKGVMSSLFQMFVKIDFDTIWEEFEERLMEEVDYENEARNIHEMDAYYKDFDNIIFPKVYDELSTRHILTMELVEGIPPSDVHNYDRELRDKWGAVITEFLFTGLFDLNMIHADPNFANFAFRDDGSLIVYDFGCIKRLDKEFMRSYIRLVRAVLDNERDRIPGLLKALEVTDGKGNVLSRDLIDPFLDLLKVMIEEGNPYNYGIGAKKFFADVIEYKNKHWKAIFDLKFHKNFVFIDRTLGGHAGNLGKMQATIHVNELLRHHTENK